MRDGDDGLHWPAKADLTASQRRNLHDFMIGCVAMHIIAYGIARLLWHLLAYPKLTGDDSLAWERVWE